MSRGGRGLLGKGVGSREPVRVLLRLPVLLLLLLLLHGEAVHDPGMEGLLAEVLQVRLLVGRAGVMTVGCRGVVGSEHVLRRRVGDGGPLLCLLLGGIPRWTGV